MRSTSGQHFIALDHVRALAAFMVFTWHFTHNVTGYPVPFGYVPGFFPLALLDEGHTGVALFMTLSGYLFAKLLDGKSIRYSAFIWNRVLRLLPLLLVVMLVVGISQHRHDLSVYCLTLLQGIVLPKWPNGGWSIAVEFHYYLILPLFIWMIKKSKWLPLVLISGVFLIRILIYTYYSQVQEASYYSIIGRIDQFALGMILFNCRNFFIGKHLLALGLFLSFCMYFWFFDRIGGYYQNPSYPSTSPIWIIMPTIEAVAYAILIAWYETSFQPAVVGISAWIGKIGEYSYSIYLLHFFIVFKAPYFIQKHIMDISNFYVACFWSFITFIGMMPIGYLSYRFIEAPFLKYRKRYIIQ